MISAPVLCLTDLADSLQVIVPLLYMPAFPLTFILLRSRVRPETLNKVREMHTIRAQPRRSAVAGCIHPETPPKGAGLDDRYRRLARRVDPVRCGSPSRLVLG